MRTEAKGYEPLDPLTISIKSDSLIEKNLPGGNP